MNRTFEDYIIRIFNISDSDKAKGSGRFMMSVLADFHPDLYSRIACKSNLDPRFDVTNVPVFIEFIANNWKEY